jgi:hypothetical protein
MMGEHHWKKAKENKKKDDLEYIYRKGKPSKTKNHVMSKKLLDVAGSVGLDLRK